LTTPWSLIYSSQSSILRTPFRDECDNTFRTNKWFSQPSQFIYLPKDLEPRFHRPQTEFSLYVGNPWVRPDWLNLSVSERLFTPAAEDRPVFRPSKQTAFRIAFIHCSFGRLLRWKSNIIVRPNITPSKKHERLDGQLLWLWESLTKTLRVKNYRILSPPLLASLVRHIPKRIYMEICYPDMNDCWKYESSYGFKVCEKCKQANGQPVSEIG